MVNLLVCIYSHVSKSAPFSIRTHDVIMILHKQQSKLEQSSVETCHTCWYELYEE